ncbi:MAG: DUF3987 domain-containing protein, partial [Planctomycetes bacterium]|nr:DUF3987 domain-containing protein [Planctomycetota bacterium]
LDKLPKPPDTIECLTGGGGRHLYFAHPGGDVRNSAGTLGEGLDVRGHHGYVVAPPSNHASGGEYRWKADPRAVELAVCPQWVLGKNVSKSKTTGENEHGEAIAEGKRNDVLTSLAGTMRNRGLGHAAILAALQAENAEKCKPPLDDAEVEQIARSVSRYEPQTKSEWEPPAPLGQFDLPIFPLEAFPGQLCVLREFCEAIAEAYQVPADLPAMLVLSVGGAALAKKVVVHVRGDHWEPVNLFTVVALPPGNRKSGVFRAVIEPLAEFERQEVERLAPEIDKSRNKRLILEESLKNARKQAATAKKLEDRKEFRDETEKIMEELRETEVLKSPQYIGNDATPQSVALLLDDNGERFALLSAEGEVFDLMAGRYSSGSPNIDVYLKGHAGDDIRVNRADRDFKARYVHKPALTIGVTVQPEVLRGLALNKGFRGRGLLGRFLYSIPKSLLGYRKINAQPVDQGIAAAYKDKILEALLLEWNKDDDGKPCAYIVTVQAEALVDLDRFATEVEKQLAPGGEFTAMADWAAKLVGAVCRIAGILHGLIYADSGNPANTQISPETMLGAIAIGEYLVEHAKAAFFEMGSDPAIDTARKVLDWVSAGEMAEFSKRDAFIALRGGIQKVSELEEPLEMLVKHGYVREIEQERKGPGRKPSQPYETNPLWLAQNTQNAHNGPGNVDSAHCAQFAREVTV